MSEKISCSNCRFARRVRMSPHSLEKNLTCRFFPPQNVVMATPQGPQLIGSGFAVVADTMWCFQFRRAENLAEIDGEDAPKLVLDSIQSKLNG